MWGCVVDYILIRCKFILPLRWVNIFGVKVTQQNNAPMKILVILWMTWGENTTTCLLVRRIAWWVRCNVTEMQCELKTWSTVQTSLPCKHSQLSSSKEHYLLGALDSWQRKIPFSNLEEGISLPFWLLTQQERLFWPLHQSSSQGHEREWKSPHVEIMLGSKEGHSYDLWMLPLTVKDWWFTWY